MYLRKVICFFAVALFSLNSTVVLAEESPPTGIAITVYQVAPGMEASFEEVSAKFKAAADKIGSRPYAGYSTVIGNDGQYAFASPFNSFAEFKDQRNPLQEVYEGEELASIEKMYQESTTSTDSYVIIPRPDLGVAPPEFESPPEILLLIEVTVKSGMGQQYQTFLKKLAEATKAVSPDLYYNAFQPGFGSGPIWRFGITMNWADLDTQGKTIPQRLMEHFGDRNGGKINEEGQEAVESVKFTVSRIRPDLTHSN
jgi:hypothetical protein